MLERGWPANEKEMVEFASERLGERTFATAGYVLCSLPTAIAHVLLSRGSMGEAAIRTVNLGGDANTIAAAGVGAVPARWRGFAGCEELLAWAEALAAGGAGTTAAVADLPDLVSLERSLCARRWGE